MVKEYNLIQLEVDSKNKETMSGYFRDFDTYKKEYIKNAKFHIKKLAETFDFAIHHCDFKTFTDIVDLHKKYMLTCPDLTLNKNMFLSIAYLRDDFSPYFDYLFNNGFKPSDFHNDKNDILSELFMFNLSDIANYLTDKYGIPKILSKDSPYLSDLLSYHEYDNIKELLNSGYHIQNNKAFYSGFSNDHIEDAIKLYQLLPKNLTEEENIEHIFFNTATRALNCESLCKLNAFFQYNFDTNYVHDKIIDGTFNSYVLLKSKEHINFFHNNGIVYQELFDSNSHGPFWAAFLKKIITSEGNHIFEAIEDHGFSVKVAPAYTDRVISDFISDYSYKHPRGLSDFSHLYPFMKFMGFDIFQHTIKEFEEFIKRKSYKLLTAEQLGEVDVHIQKNILKNQLNIQTSPLKNPRL